MMQAMFGECFRLRYNHIVDSLGEKEEFIDQLRSLGITAGASVYLNSSVVLSCIIWPKNAIPCGVPCKTAPIPSRWLSYMHGQEKIPYQVNPLRPDRTRRYDRGECILRCKGILRYCSIKRLQFRVAPMR
jgi:hypothetical protein